MDKGCRLRYIFARKPLHKGRGPNYVEEEECSEQKASSQLLVKKREERSPIDLVEAAENQEQLSEQDWPPAWDHKVRRGRQGRGDCAIWGNTPLCVSMATTVPLFTARTMLAQRLKHIDSVADLTQLAS